MPRVETNVDQRIRTLRVHLSNKQCGRPKIDVAKEEMEKVIQRLAPDARFNVLVYRDLSRYPPEPEATRAFPALTAASAGARAKGIGWVKEQAPLGWGAFYDALVAALEDPEVDTLFLLSDGVPSHGTHVKYEEMVRWFGVENRWRNVCIHTVLTGKVEEGGTDDRLMNELASSTGGMYLGK